MLIAPRDDLIRMTARTAPSILELRVPALEFRAAAADDGTLGTLFGYAAVFNVDTVIDSWEGKFVERIAPGAFSKTIRERRDLFKVLFNHGFDPSIGDKPLGRPADVREDKIGFYHETPLDDTSYNRDLAASLRSGALDGQSFRFSVKREEWEDGETEADLPIRTLRELVMYEFGPVTFPAYEATTAGVRARPAYLAWRTAHPSGAGGTATPETPDDAALRGTSPVVVARSVKDVAKALQRARALASLETA